MYIYFLSLDAKRRVVVDEECVINVDKSLAGPGNVTARIKSPSGQPTEIDIEDNSDGTVSIYYTPRHPGMLCDMLIDKQHHNKFYTMKFLMMLFLVTILCS